VVAALDPFDGGPHFEARTDDVWPVTRTARARVTIAHRASIADATGEHADGLVCYEPKSKRSKKDGWFRAVFTEFRSLKKNGAVVAITKDAAKALCCDEGDRVFTLPFSTHTRH
jgi:arginine/ornithine N-succinyltransferase beta subunit